MQNLVKKITALFTVKSIVTIILTAVFAYLSIVGQLSQDFMVVYTTIIAFYFGTQHEKKNAEEPPANNGGL